MINASPFVLIENCTEAIKNYQKIFGGEIKILNEQAGKVMNAELHMGGTLIHFADTMGKSVASGRNIRILLQFDSEDEIKKIYNELKIEGKVDFELQKAFFGALHASLTDKNGINWDLNCFLAR